MTDNATPSENADPADTSTAMRSGHIERWALVAAGIVALLAVWVAISRQDEAVMPASTTSEAGQQPSVSEVIARLEARLSESPDDAQGWQMLGWSYFQTGRYAEAATAFKRATTLDPENAEFHSMLGEALVLASADQGGLPADARAAFDHALSLDPTDPRARYFRAVALDLEGKHAEAIEAWFALLQDTPSDAPYAQDIRQVIADVARVSGIDVTDRLKHAKFAPPTGGMRSDGAAVATSGIPGPSRQQMQAASQLPAEQQDAMIRGMVDGLAARLKENPDDAQGWIMLMRSRMQLGETEKAKVVLGEAMAAFRNDGAEARRIREAASVLGVPQN